MDDWDEMSAALVAVLRKALPKATEEVKWKAPSFAIDGQHLVTLMQPKKGGARVILHRDAKAKDSKTGKRLLEVSDPRLTWASDQRAQVAFETVAEVKANKDWLAKLARDWVKAVRG